MPGTTEPTVPFSFANNFWGKDDAGVGPLLQRMHDAKTTMDELKAFYTARAALEDEYARKLLGLSKKALGSRETGSLKASLDVMRLEVESMAKSHLSIAGQMKTECEEPLSDFAGAMRERRRIIQASCEKLLKLKMQQTQTVNKTRDRFEQDCLKIKGYLAQAHMVMGQEEKKNKSRLEKVQVAVASSNAEYEAAIKALKETTTRWNRDWRAACDKFQDLEEERIDFIKSSCWTFCNISSIVCVSDDASCEKIRVSLEDCEVEKDISTFIMEKGTGREIPAAPKYINFCRGDVDDSASEADQDSYQTAQFPRYSNPTFRTSSPNPSVMSSQASDSQSEASSAFPEAEPERPVDRRRRRTDDNNSPPGRGVPGDTTPRRDHYQTPQETLSRSSRQQYAQDAAGHDNPNLRPSSSHASSEYTDPTGLPPNDVAQQVTPIPKEEQQTKRRSGFFSNGGPFGRKNRSSKDDAPAAAPQRQLEQRPTDQNGVATRPSPNSRNTWGPATNRNMAVGAAPSGNVYGSSQGRHNQSRLMLGGERHQSPEPIDPQSSLALNIGGNVFDVSTGQEQKQQQPAPEPAEDPIAQALAELKSVTKNAGSRSTADRFYGLATPAPAGTPGPNSTAARTPLPTYVPKSSALGLPPPAFTSAEMRQTTQQYVNQRDNLLDGPPPQMPAAARDQPSRNSMHETRQRSKTMDYQQSRPQSQHYGSQDVVPGARSPGGASPIPNRSVSPRPQLYGDASYRQPSPQPMNNRAVSPNMYTQSRPGTASSQRHGQYAAYNGASSPAQEMALAGPGNGYRNSASPAPSHHSRNDSYNARSRSRAGSIRDGYGGSASNRNSYVDQGGAVQMYQGGGGQQLARPRSKSTAGERQFARDGRPIMLYARAMYHYQAAIPEELGFAKGDVLAVLRQQDDGWWEAEVVGSQGRPGLVPSNYLQPC